ncbi:hypothetical protein OSTOST_10703, partial [Ostertagia ostertagi]
MPVRKFSEDGLIKKTKQKRSKQELRDEHIKRILVAASKGQVELPPEESYIVERRKRHESFEFDDKISAAALHRPKTRRSVVYDENILNECLSQHLWRIDEDPTKDYELLLEGLQACADAASLTQRRSSERISTSTRELLSKRRSLRLDPNATHLERLIADTSCRIALQEDIRQFRQRKILEAAQGRSSIKKCKRDLTDHRVPLSALLREDGTLTTSRKEMESIAETFYTSLFRSSTPVPDPVIPTAPRPPTILTSEVRVAIDSMKKGTAPGPDKISGFSLIEQARAQRPADLLQRNLKYMKYTDKKRKLDKNKAKKIVLEHMRKKTSKELIRKERSKITGLREPKNEKKKDESVFSDADFAVVGKKKKKLEKIPVEY